MILTLLYCRLSCFIWSIVEKTFILNRYYIWSKFIEMHDFLHYSLEYRGDNLMIRFSYMPSMLEIYRRLHRQLPVRNLWHFFNIMVGSYGVSIGSCTWRWQIAVHMDDLIHFQWQNAPNIPQRKLPIKATLNLNIESVCGQSEPLVMTSMF